MQEKKIYRETIRTTDIRKLIKGINNKNAGQKKIIAGEKDTPGNNKNNRNKESNQGNQKQKSL